MSHLSPPPLRTPIYINGVMSPVWWRWFSDLFARAEFVGTSVGIDDTTASDIPAVENNDNALIFSAIVSELAARVDDLARRLEDALTTPKDDQTIDADQIGYVNPYNFRPVNHSGDYHVGPLSMRAGTTTFSPLSFSSGALKTTPASGDFEYYDGHFYITDGGRHAISASAGVKTSTTTVVNTTTETTIYSHTFAANELHADEKVTCEAIGAYSNASAADDFTIRFKLAGVTLHTLARVGGNETDAGFLAEYIMTIRSAGAGGTYVDFASLSDSENVIMSGESGAHSIDTTASNVFEITVQWTAAKAGNTLSCSQGYVRFDH